MEARWRLLPMNTYISEPICLSDARHSTQFTLMVQAVYEKLLSDLPSGKKFQVRWVNIFNKETNPHGMIGNFIAVESLGGSEAPEPDLAGLMANLKRSM